MKRYEEYKDSGAAWIGEVPAPWEACRLKAHLRRNEPRNPGGQQVLSLYRELGIVPKDSRDDNHNVTSEDTSNYKYVRPGDFVINKMKAWQGSVAVSDYEGVVSPAYYIYQFTDDVYERRYFHYLLRSCYKEEFMRLSGGIRIGQWDLSSEDLDNVIVLMPSKEEQVAIAVYLDKETEYIDTLIDEAKASIEEYKAWKASIIYEAVTKGLDKNVEMKDSGVEWIGKIPIHWKLSRIKNEVINLDYLREPISAENRDNKLGLYDYYGASGAIDKIDDYNVDDTVLLIGEDGANLRMRNLPLVYRASGKIWVNNHAHILKVKEKNNYGYMAYLLEAGDYNIYITGAAQPKLSQFNLMRYQIPVAPREEQDAINDYLDVNAGKINNLIEEKESLISDLEAYKKSLIFEVVTGKRKVV